MQLVLPKNVYSRPTQPIEHTSCNLTRDKKSAFSAFHANITIGPSRNSPVDVYTFSVYWGVSTVKIMHSSM